MPCVVAFNDVFAPVTEISIAEQESHATVMEVVLMVALDCIRHDRYTNLVLIAMPAPAGEVPAQFDGLIHLCVRKRLVLALIPPESPECAQVSRQLLLNVVPETILESPEVFM